MEKSTSRSTSTGPKLLYNPRISSSGLASVAFAVVTVGPPCWPDAWGVSRSGAPRGTGRAARRVTSAHSVVRGLVRSETGRRAHRGVGARAQLFLGHELVVQDDLDVVLEDRDRDEQLGLDLLLGLRVGDGLAGVHGLVLGQGDGQLGG